MYYIVRLSYLYFFGSTGVLVAHACNPSYSGGRDQDFSLSQPKEIVLEKEKEKEKKKRKALSGASGSHTCNPSYSGGRDQ
jgi:hypothetical protein